jgi:hypothetical protein
MEELAENFDNEDYQRMKDEMTIMAKREDKEAANGANMTKSDNSLHWLISNYGWVVGEGERQKTGSCADIYAEQIAGDYKYFMLIDGGNCNKELINNVVHVYAGDFKGKIFEGCIETAKEFKVVMKVLGFNDNSSVNSTYICNVDC